MMSIISTNKLFYASIALIVAYRFYWETTTGARRRALAKQHGTHAPKAIPARDPIFGLDSLWGNLRVVKEHRVMQWFQDHLTNNNAHTVSMRILWNTIIITDDPENIKAVLATNFDVWSIGEGRIKQMAAYLGFGIFTNEGAAWKHSRSMLRPCFERSQIADISILHRHMNRFMNLLPKDGTTIDLQPLFHQLTLDISSEFLFGRSTNSLQRDQENKECEDFVEAFEYCMNPYQNDNESALWILKFFLPDRKFTRCAKRIQAFADKFIDEELASKSSNPDASSDRYVFLHELIAQTSDRKVIRAELLNVLLAGRDTTAALLSNIFWEISRHPHVLERLRREIKDHVDGNAAAVPSYEQLKDMKYLKAVINESQRLYPIVPCNSRDALHDTIIPRGGGPDGMSPVLISKGSPVVFLPFAMHRRHDLFGNDALEFRPERWLDGENLLRPGWGYLPFGGGPRVCIGQNFALTETMFVVVRLLQSFEIESRDAEPWREKLSIICSGLGGCKVALKKRN